MLDQGRAGTASKLGLLFKRHHAPREERGERRFITGPGTDDQSSITTFHRRSL